ncbi:MAG: OadG family protein [Candidatus Cloacimonetes bacterium]|nr:OadG family protein [Candidatus Cloacimonadota bacterium]
MKRILVYILLLSAVSLCAVKHDVYSGDATVKELASKAEIPVKKLIENLNRTDISIDKTVAEQGISQQDFQDALKNYEENIGSFYAGVVVVGIGIVFISLILVGFVIHQLRHLNTAKEKPSRRRKTVKTAVGSVTGPAEHISSNAIVAVVSAIYLHELEVEQQNNLLLTFRRAPLSMWKASNIMSNNEFFQGKRGK